MWKEGWEKEDGENRVESKRRGKQDKGKKRVSGKQGRLCKKDGEKIFWVRWRRERGWQEGKGKNTMGKTVLGR